MAEVIGEKLSDEERHDIAEAAGHADPDGHRASIDMEDYNKIMSNLQRLTLKKGEYVFREGDEGTHFFFINRGYWLMHLGWGVREKRPRHKIFALKIIT